jgi:hypothetical protein
MTMYVEWLVIKDPKLAKLSWSQIDLVLQTTDKHKRIAKDAVGIVNFFIDLA